MVFTIQLTERLKDHSIRFHSLMHHYTAHHVDAAVSPRSALPVC